MLLLCGICHTFPLFVRSLLDSFWMRPLFLLTSSYNIRSPLNAVYCYMLQRWDTPPRVSCCTQWNVFLLPWWSPHSLYFAGDHAGSSCIIMSTHVSVHHRGSSRIFRRRGYQPRKGRKFQPRLRFVKCACQNERFATLGVGVGQVPPSVSVKASIRYMYLSINVK